METFTGILSTIFIIALLILIAPTVFDFLVAVFVVGLQIVLALMIVSFIVGCLRELFGDTNEGERSYNF